MRVDVRAYAMLQYGLCLLIGYGISVDIKLGIDWCEAAAQAGNRAARAVLRRLLRVYGSPITHDATFSSWLMPAASSGSHWALEELRELDSDTHLTALRASVYLDADWTELVACFKRVRHRYNLRDVTRLQRQLGVGNDHSVTSSGRWGPGLDQDGSSNILRSLAHYACIYAAPMVLFTIFEAMKRHRLSPKRFLCVALRAGRVDTARLILDYCADLTQLEESMPNPLFHLSEIPEEDMEFIVHSLVSRGVDVNEKIHRGLVWKMGNYTSEPLRLSETSWFREHPVSPGPPGYTEFPGSSGSFGLLELPDMIVRERLESPESPAGTAPAPKHWDLDIAGESVTPLRWAIIHRKPRLVYALLKNGAQFPRLPDRNADVSHDKDELPESLAQVFVLDEPCYDLEILQMFLDRHGAQDQQAAFPETPLGLIVMEPEWPCHRLRHGKLLRSDNLSAVLSLLRAHQPEDDAIAMWGAIKNGHLNVVQCMLDQGVNIEIRHRGLTPLHMAILYGRQHIFLYLLDRGADPATVTNNEGISAVHLNFWKPAPDDTEQLILGRLHEALGRVDRMHGKFGQTVNPLHLAVLNGRASAVADLISLGADPCAVLEMDINPTFREAWPDDRDTWKGVWDDGCLKGMTPIGTVLTRWDVFLPKQIIDLIAVLTNPIEGQPDDTSRYFTRPEILQTALHILPGIETLMRLGLFKDLLTYGSAAGLHINIQDAEGDTPLHYAALLVDGRQHMQIHPSHTVVADLLSLGADPKIRNSRGMTANDIGGFGCMYLVNQCPLPVDGLYTKYAPHLECRMPSESGSSDDGRASSFDDVTASSFDDETTPNTADSPVPPQNLPFLNFWAALRTEVSFDSALNLSSGEMITYHKRQEMTLMMMEL